jgi:hypothetical protein
LNNLNSLKNSLNAGNKNKIISAIVIALFVTSMLVAVAPVRAQDEGVHGGAPTQTGYVGPTTIPAGQTADFTIHPLCFLSVSPNPIGVGQMALVNMWITFPSGEGKFMNGYSVVITKPDGTTETVNKQSYVADGTSWFQYIPTQIGAYQFQFFFAGEYYPAGYYSNGNYSATRTGAFASAIFNPSDYVTPENSPITTLNVQQQEVASWDGLMANAGQSLPTGYWSHPIEPNNRNWANVAGNYPWGETLVGQGTVSWNDEYYGPYIPAVHTPHILWERTGPVAGIIGGETGNYALSGAGGTPSLIFMGRAYQTVTKSIDGLAPQSFAECYDIQTGQIYYDILAIASGGTGVTPTNINYYLPSLSAVPGEAADTSFTSELYTVSGTKLYKVNPSTGAITANITIPSGLSTYFIRDGVIMSFQQIYTNSSTPAPDITVTDSATGNLVSWTVQGGSSTSNTATAAQIATAFATRVTNNITITIPSSLRTQYQTGSYGAFGAYDPVSGITVIQSRFLHGGFYGSSYVAVSTITGKQLWNVTTAKDSMESAYRPTNAWCRQGLYIAEMERGYVEARNINTGAVVWQVTIPDYPWGEFWMYDEAAYQDLVFGVGYVGVIAINQTSGTLAWQYADPAVPFETPYTSTSLSNGTTYSVQNIRVLGSGSDAMLYVQNSEHTPSQPATRGWGLIALNATTGQFMWKISGTALGAGPASSGILFTSSSYDGTMVVMGKGISSTTVSAPQTAITAGTAAIISGAVMDQSPAQPNTPAISDASMSTWMDYLHFQMPVGGIYNNITVTGVPVSIDATDPNGNFIHIADATSDMSGTFGYTWTPTTTGDYKITATFMGSDSYGSSYAQTYAHVAAAHATETPAPTASMTGLATTTDLMTYIVVGVVAMIIALAIATVLILRKH